MTIKTAEVFEFSSLPEFVDKADTEPEELLEGLSCQSKQRVLDEYNGIAENEDEPAWDVAETVGDLPEHVFENYLDWVRGLGDNTVIEEYLENSEQEYIHHYNRRLDRYFVFRIDD